jgi:hypothetical protein
VEVVMRSALPFVALVFSLSACDGDAPAAPSSTEPEPAVRTLMRRLRVAALLAAAVLLSSSTPLLSGCSGDDGCCRVCRTGKACGDSCIERSLTCSQGPGCACDG